MRIASRCTSARLLETIARLEGEFDFVFIDADKTGYIDYYEAVLPRLSERGLIAADNTLSDGRVVDGSRPEIVAFNEHVMSDDRVISRPPDRPRRRHAHPPPFIKAASRFPSARSSRSAGRDSRSYGSSSMRPSVVAPRPGHATVDEEGRDGRRVLRGEDDRAVLLRQDARAPGVDEQHRVPPGQEANRRRRVGRRQRGTREVEQLATPFVAEAAQPQSLECGSEQSSRDPGPGRDVLERRRAEPAEVRPDEMVDGRPSSETAPGPTHCSASA